MIRRCIAKRATDNRVVAEVWAHTDPARLPDREGKTRGLRQMRSDGARLWRHPKRAASPDLMTAAELGSAEDARNESRVSRIGVEPGSFRARAIIKPPER